MLTERGSIVNKLTLTARAAGLAFGTALRGAAKTGGDIATIAKTLPFAYWDKGAPKVILDADGFAVRAAREGEKGAVKFRPYFHCPIRCYAIAAYMVDDVDDAPDKAREAVALAPATVQRYVASRVKAEVLGQLDDLREKAAKRQAKHQAKLKAQAKGKAEPEESEEGATHAPTHAPTENSLLGVFRAIPADKRVAAMVHCLTEAYPKDAGAAGFLSAVFDKLGIEPVIEE